MGVKYITTDGNIWRGYEEQEFECNFKASWEMMRDDSLIQVKSGGYGDRGYAYIQKRNIVAVYWED